MKNKQSYLRNMVLNRPIALRIHDNSGECDVDNHVLPFDGNM